MQKFSDEELINQAAGFSCGCDKCLARVEPPRKELLSRLERGRKAIETMGKLFKEYESFLISDASGEYDSLKCKKAFFKKLEEIITSQT